MKFKMMAMFELLRMARDKVTQMETSLNEEEEVKLKLPEKTEAPTGKKGKREFKEEKQPKLDSKAIQNAIREEYFNTARIFNFFSNTV